MKANTLIRNSLILFFTLCITIASYAVESVEGKVAEKGFGKFYLDDESGTRFHIFESKKLTTYTPDTWRPNTGDKIKVTYTKEMGRNQIKLVAAKIELVEKGPMSTDFESPVDVEIVEIGRRKIKVNVISANQIIRFDKARGMQMVPAGWVPMSGEKAKLYFTSKPAKFTYNMARIANKIEKIS